MSCTFSLGPKGHTVLQFQRLNLPCLFAIFQLLRPTDLGSLGKASSFLDNAVAAYHSHVILVLFSQFVSHPDRLLNVMESSDAVLSGSAILPLLYRLAWNAADLDFYCDHAGFYMMIYHLTLAEDYVLLNPHILDDQSVSPRHRALQRVRRPYDDHSHISSVAHLKKGDLQIDIVLSSSTSPLDPIAAFWATHVQNFLTPHLICLAYPLLLEERQSLLAPAQLVDMQLPAGFTLPLIRKYEMRGFKFAVRNPAFDNSVLSEISGYPYKGSRGILLCDS